MYMLVKCLPLVSKICWLVDIITNLYFEISGLDLLKLIPLFQLVDNNFMFMARFVWRIHGWRWGTLTLLFVTVVREPHLILSWRIASGICCCLFYLCCWCTNVCLNFYFNSFNLPRLVEVQHQYFVDNKGIGYFKVWLPDDVGLQKQINN